MCRDEFEREQFIDNLLYALSQTDGRMQDMGQAPGIAPTSTFGQAQGVAPTSSLTLVLTIRADFYAHLAEYPELRDLVAKQQEFIGPMNAEELRRAIEEPAKQGNWEFEPGLVDLILRDVGDEPGALPLLSHALLETWKRRSGHLMTLKGYHDAGGVRGAIAHTAESTYQQLSPEQQTIARNIFLRLTELGEGTEDTRRKAEIGELETGDWSRQDVRDVLTLLADARLITTHENTAEVAHEALIREWPRLRAWLNENRDGLKLHRALTEAAHEWALMERDASALYRDARLAQAREFASVNPNVLNAGERAFLEASKENAERETREREEQQQRELVAAQKLAETEQSANKRLRQRAVFLAGACVLAILLAGIALFFGNRANQSANAAAQNALTAQNNAAQAELEKGNAEQQQRIATARELAASASTNLTVDPERSTLLSLEAIKATEPDKIVLPEVEEVLHQSIYSSHLLRALQGHSSEVYKIVYTPDGSRVATQSTDGTIRIWDPNTGQEFHRLPVFLDYIENLTVSRDGKRLASIDVSPDQTLTAKIWEIQSGELLTSTQIPIAIADWTFSSYNSDLSHVAVGGVDGSTTIWDVKTGKQLLKLSGHTELVNDVAYSPDNARLATGSYDKTAKIWDATTGKELLTLSGHVDRIVNVTFSADGMRLGTASADGTAKIWDAITGKELLTLGGHANTVNEIAFSQDGTKVATISLDATAKVWDAKNGTLLLTLFGLIKGGDGVAFSPDGTRLATAIGGGYVKIWDITPSREALTIPLSGLNSDWFVSTVLYSPDGAHLAAGLQDGTIHVWDTKTGTEQLILRGHTSGINRIAYSRDGTRLASASDDHTVKIWDAASGNEIMSIHQDASVFAVAFSPDGTRLAIGLAIDLQKKKWTNWTIRNKETGVS